MLLGDCSDGAQLLRSGNPVRQAYPHHEVLGRQSFAAFAADRAYAVALRIDAPPFEVHARPLSRDGAASFARELANLLDVLPRIQLALQALQFLRLSLFHLCCLWHDLLCRLRLGRRKLCGNKKPIRCGWASLRLIGDCKESLGMHLHARADTNTTTTHARDGEMTHS